MISLKVVMDHEEMSRMAALELERAISDRPDALLCLATGGTPMRAYEILAERQFSRAGFFEAVRILKLDEWGGLNGDDPASCECFLRRTLIDVLGIGDRYIGFTGNPDDPEAECRRIATWLGAHGPIDLCVLGLGLNGHLGFNEPASELIPHAHLARLSESSLAHSMLEKARARPTYGLTLGMADILQSRRILLVVSGLSKRESLRRLLSGSVRTDFPASFLKLHPDVVLICDRASCPD